MEALILFSGGTAVPEVFCYFFRESGDVSICSWGSEAGSGLRSTQACLMLLLNFSQLHLDIIFWLVIG